MKHIFLEHTDFEDAQKALKFYKENFNIENLKNNIEDINNLEKEKGLELDEKSIVIIAKKIAKIPKHNWYDNEDNSILYEKINDLFEKLGRNMNFLEITENRSWDYFEDSYEDFNNYGKKLILINFLIRIKRGIDFNYINNHNDDWIHTSLWYSNILIEFSNEFIQFFKIIDKYMKGATHLTIIFNNFLKKIINMIEKGEVLKHLEEKAKIEIETNKFNFEKAKATYLSRVARHEAAINDNKIKGGLYDRRDQDSLWSDFGELLVRQNLLKRGIMVSNNYHDAPDYIKDKLKDIYNNLKELSINIKKFNKERLPDDPLWKAIKRAEEGHQQYLKSMNKPVNKYWLTGKKRKLFEEFLKEIGEEFKEDFITK